MSNAWLSSTSTSITATAPRTSFEDDSRPVHFHPSLCSYFIRASAVCKEVGVGRGKGYTVNVPLPPHVGDHGYGRVFDELIEPRLTLFEPELILVSADSTLIGATHWPWPA